MNKPDKNEEIPLMKPFLPPIEDIQAYLVRIWESRQLTNTGSIQTEFEKALCDYLGVKHICLFANGTLALMIALKALNLKGEIITTPFTSVATAQAIYWNSLKPVFADINELDFNIHPDEIEHAITPATCAILPVHVFGNPCQVEVLEKLAQKHNLKLIYDAAHCFGVKTGSESILNFGALSVLSLHATKVFNSIEGGAVICHDEFTKKTIDALKNTGLDTNHELAGYGMNAKMNEVQASFGLSNLPYVDKVIALRKIASLKYRQLLKEIRGLKLMKEPDFVRLNYTYFPVIVDPEKFGASRDELSVHLRKNNIVTRNYFHPLVTDYPEFKIYKTRDLPVARKIADNVLCLPLFHDIKEEEIVRIVKVISSVNRNF